MILLKKPDGVQYLILAYITICRMSVHKTVQQAFMPDVFLAAAIAINVEYPCGSIGDRCDAAGIQYLFRAVFNLPGRLFDAALRRTRIKSAHNEEMAQWAGKERCIIAPFFQNTECREEKDSHKWGSATQNQGQHMIISDCLNNGFHHSSPSLVDAVIGIVTDQWHFIDLPPVTLFSRSRYRPKKPFRLGGSCPRYLSGFDSNALRQDSAQKK